MPKKFKQHTAPQIMAAKSLLAEAKQDGATLIPIQSKMTVALNRVRTETHNDRVYEIYPAVLLREMVLRGNGNAFEKGAAFVPGEEIEATSYLWSDVPVLVNHPEWGLGNEQFNINEDGLGRVFNPWYHSGDNELRAELWIDQEKAEKNNRWVDIKKQADNGSLELSTGFLLLEIEEKEGSFEGKDYATIMRGIIPLHLAVLPDDTGACSNADGCGLNMAGNSKARGTYEVLISALETYGLKKIFPNLGELKPGDSLEVALNSQTDREIQMLESAKLLVAVLMSAIGLTEEQAVKLIGSCDCDDLNKLATANLTALHDKADKVAGLQTDLGIAEAALKVHTDKEVVEEEKLRGSYLKALGFSDEDAAIKETKTAALKAMAGKKNLLSEDGSTLDDAAIAALQTGDDEKKPHSPDAPTTTPTEKG